MLLFASWPLYNFQFSALSLSELLPNTEYFMHSFSGGA